MTAAQQESIAAIILAAGESTRMGRLKQLLPWGETTLLAWQAAQMRKAGATDVIVVLGHEADAIRAAVGDLDVRLVVNEAYQEGRASSLRCGADAVADDVAAVLILGVDQPRPAAVSHALIARWQETKALLVIPSYGGRRGHPVLADGSLLAELRSVTEEELGLRAVTERHLKSTELVILQDQTISLDLNTPADYQSAYVMFSRSGWP
jgi:molybdenum cofactor cytidylyltransferase